MHKMVEWVKSNKILTILILFLLFFFFIGNRRFVPIPNMGYSNKLMDNDFGLMVDSVESSFSRSGSSPMKKTSSNVPDGTDRMVVGTYKISALVKDSSIFLGSISKKVSDLNGFVVSSNLYTPESTTSSGYARLRLPAKNLDQMKEFIKNSSVRITSESKAESDVTDKYYDNAARMETLNKTKLIYENMLDKAVTVGDVMKVQNQIMRLQSQIDSVKGRQMYLEKTTSTVLLTLNFSTDELELPYAPKNKFRPDVVFKYAVRGLLTTFASLGTKAIWIAVYSVIWMPLLIVGLLIKRFLNKKKEDK